MNSAPPASPLAEDRSVLPDHSLAAAFLENVPYSVYFKDRESRFIAVSAAMARHLNAPSRAAVVGRSDFDFFGEVHARTTFEHEQRIMRTGQPIVGLLERETWPDGRTTWVLTHKQPLHDGDGNIVGTCGISKDITRTHEVEVALNKTRKDLIDASRIAGMAEVANDVLHNVGTVLNSLNVSASVLANGLRQSKAESLVKLVALLREHQADLGAFLTHDPKGRRVPEFISSLAQHAAEERVRLRQEVSALQQSIDRIKEIVSMQQAYATMSGVAEPLDPTLLMEDSLRIASDVVPAAEMPIVREFRFTPPVFAEKSRVLQILVNLIRNARHACAEGRTAAPVLTLRILPVGANRIQFVVQDNGVGIPAENLTRIFQHGFTTRTGSHGFALHSGANAAREMNGVLTVHSDGPGLGAAFTLELPSAAPSIPAE